MLFALFRRYNIYQFAILEDLHVYSKVLKYYGMYARKSKYLNRWGTLDR